jgi:hypothetical protein
MRLVCRTLRGRRQADRGPLRPSHDRLRDPVEFARYQSGRPLDWRLLVVTAQASIPHGCTRSSWRPPRYDDDVTSRTDGVTALECYPSPVSTPLAQ